MQQPALALALALLHLALSKHVKAYFRYTTLLSCNNPRVFKDLYAIFFSPVPPSPLRVPALVLGRRENWTTSRSRPMADIYMAQVCFTCVTDDGHERDETGNSHAYRPWI